MSTITEKCAFISFSARLFSPDRETGQHDKAGAIIKSEKVQIINPRCIGPLTNAKNIGERACRRYGARLDAMNSWVVPLCNIDALKKELSRSVIQFEAEKTEFINNLSNFISAQIEANPADEHKIRSAMPAIRDLEKSIRISWVRHNLDLDDIEDYGLAREFDSIAEQAAWEIAQDIKKSTGTGTNYSKNTFDVLIRAADKAESFGFLSESLAAIKPAIQKLKASVNINGYSPADRLMIGAMIAFLSDHKKVANEGRHIGGVFSAVSPVQEEISKEPELPSNITQPSVENTPNQVIAAQECEYSF